MKSDKKNIIFVLKLIYHYFYGNYSCSFEPETKLAILFLYHLKLLKLRFYNKLNVQYPWYFVLTRCFPGINSDRNLNA